MTTSNSVPSCRGKKDGFTMVELMVSTLLMALVLASIIPAFAFFSKSINALGEYAVMSQDSRGGLERFGRDLHAAENLTLASVDELTVELPADMGGSSVNYKYQFNNTQNTWEVVRTVTDTSGTATSRQIMDDVTEFNFIYYNRLGVNVTESASILGECKSVQINAKLEKRIVTTKATDYIISARFLMRNFN